MMRKIEKGQKKDAEDIARLLLKVWRTNYVDFLPATFLEKLDLTRQIQRHSNYLKQQTPYFLVRDGQQQLIGFSSFGKNRDQKLQADWELYTLYVDPDFQRQGIGASLIQKVLQELPVGNTRLAVWVMEQNPYRSFYEKHGFEEMAQEEMDLGEFRVQNLGYIRNLLT